MRFSLLISVFLLLALTGNSQPFRKDSTLQQGFNKITSGDYPGAIRDFNRILRTDPDAVEALKGRAEAKLLMGDQASALLDADRACTLNPGHAAAWFIKGEIQTSNAAFKDALASYNKSFDLDPSNAETFRGLVFSSFYSGLEKEAFELVEKAISTDSKTGIYYYIRGVLLSNKEKYSKALNDFDKALNLSPGQNEFNIYLNRGVCFLNLEEPEQAEADLTRAIGLRPDNASAWHSRGRVYYFLKQYEQAIADFNESLELNPNSDVTLYNLAMTYFRIEDNKNACEYFHKSCSLGNKNACKMVMMNCANIRR